MPYDSCFTVAQSMSGLNKGFLLKGQNLTSNYPSNFNPHGQSYSIKTCQKPLPKASVMAITINKVGMDQKTLINQTIALSKYPPKKPAKAPKITPIKSEIKTATNPIESEILDPTIKRLNKSLPYLSVPKTNVFSSKCCSLKTTSEKGELNLEDSINS